MSSQLTTQSNNNQPNAVPAYQDWGPFPALTNFSWFIIGVVPLYPQFKTVKVKDVIGLSQYGSYSEFRVISHKIYVGPITNLNWLSVQSDIFSFNPANPLMLVQNGTQSLVGMSIQNIGMLPPGAYGCNLNFIIEGKNGSGQWLNVSNYTHNVKLNVYATNEIVYSPLSIAATHFQNTPAPIIPINITGPSWQIVARDKYVLTSNSPDVIITSEVINDLLIYKATGEGNAIVNLTLSGFFDTFDAIDSSHLNSFLLVLANSSQLGSIPISITLENTNQFAVSPEELSFTGIKGFLEPAIQFVFVLCIDAEYTVVSPPWLDVTSAVQTEPLSLSGLNVVPISSANLEGGTYTGEIILTATINGIVSNIAIPVNYVLQDFVQFPYSLNEFNFTLDKKYLNFSTEYPDTYFYMVMTCKVFKFYTDDEKTLEIPLKIPLYQKKQSYNVGLGIHRIMQKVKQLLMDSAYQYKPAEINFLVQEKNNSDDTVIREIATERYFFVAGHNPGILENAGIFDTAITRVTKKGIHYLNILTPQVPRTVKMYRNELFYQEYLLEPLGNIISDKITFDQFNQGDVIEYRLTLEASSISKRFIIFPDGYASTMIIWEGNNLLKSSFEFTGKLQVKSDYENRTFTSYVDLAEVTKIIETKKISKLTINTGHITRMDIGVIDSLLLSHRAWLISGENLIELIPIQKNYIPNDSDRELLSFDVEFQINRKYNEEVYTF